MAAALLYCNVLQTLLNWVEIKSQLFSLQAHVRRWRDSWRSVYVNKEKGNRNQ